jgi:hypothetical protein
MNTMENVFFDFMAMTFEPPKLGVETEQNNACAYEAL